MSSNKLTPTDEPVVKFVVSVMNSKKASMRFIDVDQNDNHGRLVKAVVQGRPPSRAYANFDVEWDFDKSCKEQANKSEAYQCFWATVVGPTVDRTTGKFRCNEMHFRVMNSVHNDGYTSRECGSDRGAFQLEKGKGNDGHVATVELTLTSIPRVHSLYAKLSQAAASGAEAVNDAIAKLSKEERDELSNTGFPFTKLVLEIRASGLSSSQTEANDGEGDNMGAGAGVNELLLYMNPMKDLKRKRMEDEDEDAGKVTVSWHGTRHTGISPSTASVTTRAGQGHKSAGGGPRSSGSSLGPGASGTNVSVSLRGKEKEEAIKKETEIADREYLRRYEVVSDLLKRIGEGSTGSKLLNRLMLLATNVPVGSFKERNERDERLKAIYEEAGDLELKRMKEYNSIDHGF